MGPGANALGWDQRKFEDKPAPFINSETRKISAVDPETSYLKYQNILAI